MKKIKNIKVENMVSSRGNTVPNQFEITTPEGRYFQSYNSIIAFIPNDGRRTQLGPDWNYSSTTGTYRNIFLNETRAETERKLKEGIYIINKNLPHVK